MIETFINCASPRLPTPIKAGDKVYLAVAPGSDKRLAISPWEVLGVEKRNFVWHLRIVSETGERRYVPLANFVRRLELPDSPLDNISDTSGNDDWAQEILVKGIVDALCSLGVYIRSANWYNVEVTPPFNVYEGEVVFVEARRGQDVPVVYNVSITRTLSYSVNGVPHYAVEATLVEKRKL